MLFRSSIPSPGVAAVAALALALAVAAVSPRAWAQDHGGAASHHDEGARQRALALFHRGVTEYQAGHFDASAALMRQAYAIDPEPILQYNLARALESSGDLEGAAGAYQRYLDDEPNPPDRGAVEQRIRTLRRQIAEHRALEQQAQAAQQHQAAAPHRATEPQPASSGSETSHASGGRFEPVPWIVCGIGALGVGAGVVFGVMAKSRHDAAVVEPVQRTAAQEASDADSFALIANVAFVAGGVLAAAGLTWGIVTLVGGGHGGADPTHAQLDVGPGSVSVRGVF